MIFPPHSAVASALTPTKVVDGSPEDKMVEKPASAPLFATPSNRLANDAPTGSPMLVSFTPAKGAQMAY